MKRRKRNLWNNFKTANSYNLYLLITNLINYWFKFCATFNTSLYFAAFLMYVSNYFIHLLYTLFMRENIINKLQSKERILGVSDARLNGCHKGKANDTSGTDANFFEGRERRSFLVKHLISVKIERGEKFSRTLDCRGRLEFHSRRIWSWER